jgi:hypothetical protein
LLEGSVKVTSLKTRESRLITPGQQAQLNTNGQIVINKADPDKVMHGKMGISILMEQIQEWLCSY